MRLPSARFASERGSAGKGKVEEEEKEEKKGNVSADAVGADRNAGERVNRSNYHAKSASRTDTRIGRFLRHEMYSRGETSPHA